jgi:phenylpyruvate tautomerase PptA (4-oxalocrotonate tautomerase family)
MNNSHKSDVHSAVNAAICDVVGDRSPNQGANVLVIIDEVPEGNWARAPPRTIRETRADCCRRHKDVMRVILLRLRQSQNGPGDGNRTQTSGPFKAYDVRRFAKRRRPGAIGVRIFAA